MLTLIPLKIFFKEFLGVLAVIFHILLYTSLDVRLATLAQNLKQELSKVSLNWTSAQDVDNR